MFAVPAGMEHDFTNTSPGPAALIGVVDQRCYDSHTPILFFSGAGRETDMKMAHQAGANAYVIKPNVSHLLGSIARFIPRAKSAGGQLTGNN